MNLKLLPSVASYSSALLPPRRLSVCLSVSPSACPPRCPWQNCSRTTQLGRRVCPTTAELTSERATMINHLTAPPPPPKRLRCLHYTRIILFVNLPAAPDDGHSAPARNGGRRRSEPSLDDGPTDLRTEGLIDGFTRPRCLNNNRGASYTTWRPGCRSQAIGQCGRTGR